MAVQIVEGGRYPAATAIPADQFKRFAERCAKPPAPSAQLVALMKGAHEKGRR